jgi:hypothetical protein
VALHEAQEDGVAVGFVEVSDGLIEQWGQATPDVSSGFLYLGLHGGLLFVAATAGLVADEIGSG